MTLSGVPDEIYHYVDVHYAGAALERFDQGSDQVRKVVHSSRDPLVLKWFPHSERRARDLRASATLASRLKERGWPIARLITINETTNWTFLIETYIDGRHPSSISRDVARKLVHLALSARSTVEPTHDWIQFIADQLANGGPKVDLDTLTSSSFGRKVLSSARRIVEMTPKESPFGDIVHGDFSPGNVLLSDNGELVGIVDWDAARVGDSAFDLAALEWDIQLLGRSARQSLPYIRSCMLNVSSRALIQLYRYYHTCANLSWAIGTADESASISASHAVLQYSN